MVTLPATSSNETARRVLDACVSAWDPMYARGAVRSLNEAQDHAADEVGVLTYVRYRSLPPALPDGVGVEPLGRGAVLDLPSTHVGLALELRARLRGAGALPPEPPTLPVPTGQDG